MSDLPGKAALITGASRGIGRASALALAKAGAQVIVHYGRGAKEAEAVVAEIRNTGGRADTVAADLAAPDGAHTLAKRVRGIVGDRLDILVLNAGVSKAATIEDTTVKDFDHLFAVNVESQRCQSPNQNIATTLQAHLYIMILFIAFCSQS
jgi:3-oxoacyl-[acyl-carrier protein] reductase